MRGFIFLLLVGLMAHAAFVQPGPVENASVTVREVVVVQAADVAEIDDSWKENAPPELSAIGIVTDGGSEEDSAPEIPLQEETIVGEVPSEDSIVDDSEEAEESDVEILNEGEESEAVEPPAGSDEEEVVVGDPAAPEEQPAEEVYEPTPVIEQPVLVMEEGTESTSAEDVPIEENLVEALQGE